MIFVLLLFVMGILLSAFFSGSETGFYRLTRVRLAIEALEGNWISRALLLLVNQPTIFVATTLVGNNVANYVTSLATVMASQRMFQANSAAVDVLAPIVVAPVLFVLGELLPKNLFYEAPNRLLKRCAPGFLLCVVLFSPVTLLLWLFSRLLQLFVKNSPQELRLRLARRELSELLTQGHEQGILRPAQKTLAQSMLAVANLPVKKFASPAGRVVRVPITMGKSDVLRLAQRHHRTLLPVEETRGKRELVGYLRTMDLYFTEGPHLPEPRPMVVLKENQSCLSALRSLASTEDALGHVVGSKGNTVGFITGHELRMALLRTGQL